MVSERARVHLGLAGAALVLVVCICSIIAGAVYKGDLRAGLPGSVAPDFSLRDASDMPVALADLRGDVVIVYFRGKPISEGDAHPTTAPSDSLTLSGELQSPVGDGEAEAGMVAQSPSAPDIEQLSLLSRTVHSHRLKVLDLEEHGAAHSFDAAVLSLQPKDHTVETLIDPTGDVARRFKIDQGDSKPTFIVIDPAGVIRYRGNNLSGGGAIATDQSPSPTTRPSGCPQIIQTLLASEPLSTR